MKYLLSICVIMGSTALMLNASPDPNQPIAPKQTLALNQLEAHGVSADEAATLTDVLRSNLIETGKFTCMERGQMETILKEQGFQQSGACNDQACLVEIGQLLGAQLLAAGSIGRVGKAWSITVRIISVQTGTITQTVSHNYTGPIENLLTSEMNVVAKKLAGVATGKDRMRTKIRTPILIGAVGGGVVLLGAGAYFLLSNKNASGNTPQAQVGISW